MLGLNHVFRSIFDTLMFLRKYLRTSYKEVFLASVGLLISLAVLTSAVIFVDTQRSLILTEMFEGEPVFIRVYYENSGKNFHNETRPDISSISSLTQYKLEEQGLWKTVRSVRTSEVSVLPYTLVENASTWSVLVVEFDDMTPLSHYLTSGALPDENSETSALYLRVGWEDGQNETTPKVGLEQDLVTPHHVQDGNITTPYSTGLNVSGVALVRKNQAETFWRHYPTLGFTSGSILVVPSLEDLLGRIQPEIQPKSAFYQYRHVTTYLIDLRKVDTFRVVSLVNNYEQFKFDFYREVDLADSSGEKITINNNFINAVKDADDQIQSLIVYLLLFATPVVVLALFMTHYSFGLVQKHKHVKLGVLLNRGVSRTQYVTVLVFETILSLGMSVVGSFALSIPVSTLMVRTSGFLEFNDATPPIILLLDLLMFVTRVGLVLVVLANVMRIINLGRKTIPDLEKHTMEDPTQPFWERFHLDLIMTGTGLLFYFLFVTGSAEEFDLPELLLSILVFPSPILIILGSVLLTSRVFTFLTNYLSKRLWKAAGGLFSFSLKNIGRRSRNAQRALLLIALTMAFTVAFVSFPFSYITWLTNNVYYDNGAELTIQLTDNTSFGNETVYASILDNLTQVVDDYSPVLTAKLNGEDIFVVNASTFAQAAWMDDWYVRDLSRTMEDLRTDNQSLILYDKNAEALDLKQWDTFNWTPAYHLSKDQPIFEFEVANTFEYWPKLVTNIHVNPEDDLKAVISVGTFEAILAKIGERQELLGMVEHEKHYLYINLKPEANLTLVGEVLEDNPYVRSRWFAQAEVDEQLEGPIYQAVFTQINNNLVYCLIIVITSLLMFGFLQLVERSRELAVERSLGMTLRQTTILFMYENLWFVFFGIIAGTVLGTALSSLFLLPFITNNQIPPLRMVYPWQVITGLVGVLTMFTLFTSTIPAYLSSKIEVAQQLRVE